MGERQLLIAGIDPGTTAGYAIIDLEGNVVSVDSSKELDINSLITKLIPFGRVVIIGTDKKKNPGFIEKLGIKLGAKVISPDYDLKVVEKREVVRKFKTKNQHEEDALASAFFALRKMRPLLNKVNVYVEHYGRESIKEQLLEMVLSKGLNIRDSLEMIDESRKGRDIIREVIVEKRVKEKDYIELENSLRRAVRDNEMLKMQNSKLRKELLDTKEGFEYMFKRMNKSSVDKKMKELLGFRDRRIKVFDSKLKGKDKDIGSLQDEITTLIYFLSNIGDKVLVKKLDNLGFNELNEKKDMLNIMDGDVLLVEDPDVISEKAIEILKENVKVIVYKKPVSKKVESRLPFVFVDSKKLNIEENGYFALVDKKEFDLEKNKVNMLSKVIQDYKNERLFN
ncbi:MAG: DUF460 domain-containing protein [Candidatus Woesearchaeota archaeon]|jgi:hypothetical protein|nr:DUF460 domain-containing protein [Candidatus Woesearchaeota archaeon]